MYKTITLGSCVAVQGRYVKTLSDGKVAVCVGKEVFVGTAVKTTRTSKPLEQKKARSVG